MTLVEGMHLFESVLIVHSGRISAKHPEKFGTAFRLNRPDLIVTARHVVEGEPVCTVAARLATSELRPYETGEILFPADSCADLAILKKRSSASGAAFSRPADSCADPASICRAP